VKARVQAALISARLNCFLSPNLFLLDKNF